MSDIKMVILRDNTFSLKMSIAFISFRGDKIDVHNFYTGMVKEIGQFDMVPEDYVLKIPYMLGDQVLKAMAEELAKQGVKVESEHKVHGLLEAQTRHLNDLRKMLKLPDSLGQQGR